MASASQAVLPSWLDAGREGWPPAHPAVAGLREAAFAVLRRGGLPTRRDEDWRYTRLAALERTPYLPSGTPPVLAPAAFGPPFPGVRLALAAGHLLEEHSTLDALPAGVRVRHLRGLLAEAPGEVAAALDLNAYAQRPFVAMNTAFLMDAVLVDVAGGVTLEQPIEVVHVQPEGPQPLLSCPRVILTMGAGARAELIERYSAQAGAGLITAVTRITLECGARLEHLRLAGTAAQGHHVGALLVALGADARYRCWHLAGGGALMREDVDVRLDAPGAGVELAGLYHAATDEHVDVHTRTEHAAPNCTSRERYNGVAAGRGRAVFNGRVHVHRDADGTDAQLRNANLLLSRHAEVDTKPELEIYAEDVRCTHGATVGQLDPMQLYYLRSRGLALPLARTLLTDAFCRDVLGGLPVGGAALASAEALLAERLERLEEVDA